jgi:hypothetical protein
MKIRAESLMVGDIIKKDNFLLAVEIVEIVEGIGARGLDVGGCYFITWVYPGEEVRLVGQSKDAERL